MISRLLVFHETFGHDGGEPLVAVLRERAASGGPIILDAAYPATPETVLPSGRETGSLVIVETSRLYDADQLRNVRERFTSKGVQVVALAHGERIPQDDFYRLVDFVRAMTGAPVGYVVYSDGWVRDLRTRTVENWEK